MDFELVSEDSLPALEMRIASLVADIDRLESRLAWCRAELTVRQRAAKAARTAVRGIAKD